MFKSKIVVIVPLLPKEREICFTQWAMVPPDCVSEKFIPPCAKKYYGFYIKYQDKNIQKNAKRKKIILFYMYLNDKNYMSNC